MKTKEKILIESLNLFSKRGYTEVALEDIAKNVGIKAPSLYKHYKSKEDIFNNCVEYFKKKMFEKRNEYSLPKDAKDSEIYLQISREQIINIALELFRYHLIDEVASNFRKLLLKERYNNSRLNRIYTDIFIDSPIRYQIEVFNYLISTGKFKNENSKNLSIEFYSSIYFLIQKYDMDLENIGDGEVELKELINNFCEKYEAHDER